MREDTAASATATLRLSLFDELIGSELLQADDKVVQARIPLKPEILQPLGMVHGGVYASVAEGLASLGTNHGVARDGRVALGMSNFCSMLRPLSSGAIHATARSRHAGRTMWLWDVEMRDDDGKVCAVARVTIAVRPATRNAPASS